MDVLIAETDDAKASRLRGLLQARGHKVTTRKNGLRALQALQEKAYGVALMAAELPGLSPLDIVRELRRGGRHLPVLMLGSGHLADLVACIEGGADDYLVADRVAPEELVVRVEALERRSRYPAAPQRVEANGIEIDEAAHEVRVSGRSVRLATSELRVLTCLAASMGTILSREVLIAAAYGEGTQVSENALESIIKRLRRKLGQHGARVRSVRLRGYVLVDRAD